MVLLDDRIMEYLQESGPSIPSEIADHVPYGSQHVGNRCRKLAISGFLKNLGNGVYVLTDQGERYLEGEFDASEKIPESPSETGDGTAGNKGDA
jgi:predicted transcriptional regulator